MDFKGMAPKPKKAAKGQPKSDYQKRAEQERKRVKKGSDANCFRFLCFKRPEDKAAFAARFGLDASADYITGIEIRAATAELRQGKPKRSFPPKPAANPAGFDPLADVTYSGDLSADCIAEADALMAAFDAQSVEYPARRADDSDVWWCLVFEDSEDAEGYLADWGLLKYGQLYLDGSAWLKALS